MEDNEVKKMQTVKRLSYDSIHIIYAVMSLYFHCLIFVFIFVLFLYFIFYFLSVVVLFPVTFSKCWLLVQRA